MDWCLFGTHISAYIWHLSRVSYLVLLHLVWCLSIPCWAIYLFLELCGSPLAGIRSVWAPLVVSCVIEAFQMLLSLVVSAELSQQA